MAMIDVLVNGQTEQMDEADLLKLEGGFEDDNEITRWVQYHLPKTGELVHRSVHIDLKKGMFGEGMAAAIVG